MTARSFILLARSFVVRVGRAIRLFTFGFNVLLKTLKSNSFIFDVHKTLVVLFFADAERAIGAIKLNFRRTRRLGCSFLLPRHLSVIFSRAASDFILRRSMIWKCIFDWLLVFYAFRIQRLNEVSDFFACHFFPLIFHRLLSSFLPHFSKAFIFLKNFSVRTRAGARKP